ncbi:hypothetical protein MG293_011732 [Ovis ammon polii]|uniref:Uncharacterized protein n=1 Tax=Ovis ammon polii TaxID=230172 RepID=A0AAD4Y865_OVIAM|nr:hypothetical protein MG293_011732 [Ovis ammon polii]KAI4562519.1 hypothetical protein MJT46_011481 [Ovis ammon polii x Ovis aries]
MVEYSKSNRKTLRTQINLPDMLLNENKDAHIALPAIGMLLVIPKVPGRSQEALFERTEVCEQAHDSGDLIETQAPCSRGFHAVRDTTPSPTSSHTNGKAIAEPLRCPEIVVNQGGFILIKPVKRMPPLKSVYPKQGQFTGQWTVKI